VRDDDDDDNLRRKCVVKVFLEVVNGLLGSVCEFLEFGKRGGRRLTGAPCFRVNSITGESRRKCKVCVWSICIQGGGEGGGNLKTRLGVSSLSLSSFIVIFHMHDVIFGLPLAILFTYFSHCVPKKCLAFIFWDIIVMHFNVLYHSLQHLITPIPPSKHPRSGVNIWEPLSQRAAWAWWGGRRHGLPPIITEPGEKKRKKRDNETVTLLAVP